MPPLVSARFHRSGSVVIEPDDSDEQAKVHATSCAAPESSRVRNVSTDDEFEKTETSMIPAHRWVIPNDEDCASVSSVCTEEYWPKGGDSAVENDTSDVASAEGSSTQMDELKDRRHPSSDLYRKSFEHALYHPLCLRTSAAFGATNELDGGLFKKRRLQIRQQRVEAQKQQKLVLNKLKEQQRRNKFLSQQRRPLRPVFRKSGMCKVECLWKPLLFNNKVHAPPMDPSDSPGCPKLLHYDHKAQPVAATSTARAQSSVTASDCAMASDEYETALILSSQFAHSGTMSVKSPSKFHDATGG